MTRILIIRFSSFGDVLQTLSVAGALKRKFPDAEIHWVTRAEFKPLIEMHPAVKQVWTVERSTRSLWRLGLDLRRQNFTHIYDAHNNLRSRVLGWMLHTFVMIGRPRFLRRSIYRWRRFLLFRFRINRFEMPFSGQRDLLAPLKRWGVEPEAPAPQLFLDDSLLRKVHSGLPADFIGRYVALAPSAAFPLKRWPLEYWKSLVAAYPKLKFVVLGGPKDDFLREIVNVAPDRVVNKAGALSLEESAACIAQAALLVSNDTGLLHVAEQLGRPCIALMGPAPFGFPSRPSTAIMQLDLPCRPCSKHGQGPCVNPNYHQCLRGISVEQVGERMSHLLGERSL